jgi:hypothetical protein
MLGDQGPDLIRSLKQHCAGAKWSVSSSAIFILLTLDWTYFVFEKAKNVDSRAAASSVKLHVELKGYWFLLALRVMKEYREFRWRMSVGLASCGNGNIPMPKPRHFASRWGIATDIIFFRFYSDFKEDRAAGDRQPTIHSRQLPNNMPTPVAFNRSFTTGGTGNVPPNCALI